MTTYTIFGRGNMGTAIAGVLTKGGATVEHIGSADSDIATINGDVVILAVPYPAVESIIASHKDALAGKTVIDITNPLNFETSIPSSFQLVLLQPLRSRLSFQPPAF